MIGRSVAVADRQSMPDGLRDVGLGGLCRIQHGTASGKVSGHGRGEGTTGAMGVAGLDELTL